VGTARRFPNPAAGGTDRFAAREARDTAPLALLDWVDALLAVYDAVPVARAAALLAGARELLGRVLRDPAVVAHVLADGRGDPLARRSAVGGTALPHRACRGYERASLPGVAPRSPTALW
jgi:hypothetical protein